MTESKLKRSTDMFLGVCIGVVIGHLLTIVALATAEPLDFSNDSSRVPQTKIESNADLEPLRRIQSPRGYISHDAGQVPNRPERPTISK